MNIKSKKFPKERCPYPVKRGNFCSRHFKNPSPFEISMPTRSITASVKKIQKFWRFRYNRYLAREKGPAFFVRSLCHNDTELASFEPLNTIPKLYFFTIKEPKQIWGFDIRTLIIQYEEEGKLENPYTKNECSVKILEKFKKHLDQLKRWKIPLHYTADSGLTPKQSWNLRVLDMCLRIDMLGYRIATHWFTELCLDQHKKLYLYIFTIWNTLSDEIKEKIVPENMELGELFKWAPERIQLKTEIDSVRRTNINVIERLISSATEQSDKTLGAMYCVMALTQVSYKCRNAYPWLIN
jgi:hypothetical protein